MAIVVGAVEVVVSSLAVFSHCCVGAADSLLPPRSPPFPPMQLLNPMTSKVAITNWIKFELFFICLYYYR